MVTYRDLYYMLFGALSKAEELLEKEEGQKALEVLIAAQQKAEELVLEEELD